MASHRKEAGAGGMMKKATAQAWLQASRLPFYVATFIPLFIGWALAVKTGSPARPGRFILVFLGSFTVHLLTNLANDYFDHVVGTDAGKAIGGCGSSRKERSHRKQCCGSLSLSMFSLLPSPS
jgi:1,4-dihydroxy-2-naphthoate octaprenyltransferase